MILFLVIFGLISVILLFLLVMQSLEIKSIKQQFRNISDSSSNELIHTQSGGKSTHELILEINKILKEMRKSKIEYQHKIHESQQMMTNISHDLRTPLTSALGYIDLIRTSDLPDDEKDREIQIIEKRLLRLSELIDSFFEFSKIISGGEKPDIKSINLVEILQESIIHYYDDFNSQKREIILDCPVSRLKINSNKNMLMRIFDNLIANALKHGTGRLTVSVTNSKEITISFANELLDSDLDTARVFDEFYTTDISRTKGNTGLGLAISKQFTEMIGGKISASYLTKTFTVTVSIPENYQP